MSFKIILDEQRCELHGECVVDAPEIFDIKDDDDDHVTLLMADVPDELRAQAETAVDDCPVQALRIED
jgi:ferredoxin